MEGVKRGYEIDVREMAKANWGDREQGLVTLPDAISFAEFVLDSYKESLKDKDRERGECIGSNPLPHKAVRPLPPPPPPPPRTGNCFTIPKSSR